MSRIEKGLLLILLSAVGFALPVGLLLAALLSSSGLTYLVALMLSLPIVIGGSALFSLIGKILCLGSEAGRSALIVSLLLDLGTILNGYKSVMGDPLWGPGLVGGVQVISFLAFLSFLRSLADDQAQDELARRAVQISGLYGLGLLLAVLGQYAGLGSKAGTAALGIWLLAGLLFLVLVEQLRESLADPKYCRITLLAAILLGVALVFLGVKGFQKKTNDASRESFVKIPGGGFTERQGRPDTLQGAAEEGNFEQLKELFENDPSQLDAPCAGGYTALHLACRTGSLECVQFLIEKGADIEAKAENGVTPLMCSLMYERDAQKALLLLDKGAGPAASDTYKKSAVHYAALGGNLEAMLKFQELGVLDEPGELLIPAVRGGNEQICQMLLKSGADPTQGLLTAADTQNLKVVKVLVEAGADLSVVDDFGENALHNAVDGTEDAPELAKYLLDKGMDVNALTKFGKTPLDSAERFSGNTGSIEVLKARGGKRASEL